MGDEVHVTVNYYARVGYGHHIQSYCAHLLLKRPQEPLLLFWHVSVSKDWNWCDSNACVTLNSLYVIYSVGVCKVVTNTISLAI
jgi:hypothetical protein